MKKVNSKSIVHAISSSRPGHDHLEQSRIKQFVTIVLIFAAIFIFVGNILYAQINTFGLSNDADTSFQHLTVDELRTNLIVYSNAEGLHIRMPELTSTSLIRIYNINGRLVKQVEGINMTGGDWETKFNYSGLFIIAVHIGNKLVVKKFLN